MLSQENLFAFSNPLLITDSLSFVLDKRERQRNISSDVVSCISKVVSPIIFRY